MSKHTQEQWQRDGKTLYALTTDDRGRQCNKWPAHFESAGRAFEASAEELEANVRLAKYAPVMLAELRKLVAMYDRGELVMEWQSKINSIVKVIENATGEKV